MANVTAEGGNSTFCKTWSSLEIAGIMIAAVNILLSITASLGNILILIGLRNVSSLHPPTKLMFQCLAIADLGVGLIPQPQMVSKQLNVYKHVDSSCASFGIIFCGVSFFTVTALSVNRLLALLLGLRYRHVVTLRRVRAVIACSWFTTFLLVLVWKLRTNTANIIIIILITLSLIISLFSYTSIVLRLRHYQSRVRDNVHEGQANIGGIPLHLERYKRTVVSLALVQLALVICYVPFLSFLIVEHLNVFPVTASLYPGLRDSTATLLFLNSSLNPFLYCWRIKELRQAVKATIKRFCTCIS